MKIKDIYLKYGSKLAVKNRFFKAIYYVVFLDLRSNGVLFDSKTARKIELL